MEAASHCDVLLSPLPPCCSPGISVRQRVRIWILNPTGFFRKPVPRRRRASSALRLSAPGTLGSTGNPRVAGQNRKLRVDRAREMSSEELRANFSELAVGSQTRSHNQTDSSGDPSSDGGVQVTCFTEDLHDVTLHFQVIRFSKQIFAWVGCNTAKFGHLYAAATTRPDNRVSVTSVLGGSSDNTGSGMARRLVLKTGLNIVLACNIPKDSPMLEAAAERKVVEKLRSLGYIKSKAGESSTSMDTD